MRLSLCAALVAVTMLATGCGQGGGDPAKGAADLERLAESGDATPEQVEAALRKAMQARKGACPPKLSLPARAEGAPADDVLAIRTGMERAEMEQLLLCENDQFVFYYAGNRYDDKPAAGDEFFTAVVGEFEKPPTALEAEAFIKAQLERSAVDHVGQERIYGRAWPSWRRRDEQIFALLVGLKDNEQVIGVKRDVNYRDDAFLPTADVIAGLEKKYGPAHARVNGEGAATLFWAYDTIGRPLPKSEDYSSLFQECTRNVTPYAQSWEWRPDCGLTILATINYARDNENLARGFVVAMMDQATADKAVEDFELVLAKAEADRKQRELDQVNSGSSAPEQKF